MPNLASQIRVAFASMAWKTGSSSPGELTDDLSTSDVAVCCSSNSSDRMCVVLGLKQPRVLDRDDGLGGEVLQVARSACR